MDELGSDRSGFGPGGDKSGRLATVGGFQVCTLSEHSCDGNSHISSYSARSYSEGPQLPLDDRGHGASVVPTDAGLDPVSSVDRGTTHLGSVLCHEGDRRSRAVTLPAFSRSRCDVDDANCNLIFTRCSYDSNACRTVLQTLECGRRLGPMNQTESSEDGCSKIAQPSSPRRSVEFSNFNFTYDSFVARSVSLTRV